MILGPWGHCPAVEAGQKPQTSGLLSTGEPQDHLLWWSGSAVSSRHNLTLHTGHSFIQQTHGKHSCAAGSQGRKNHGWNFEADESYLEKILESIVVTIFSFLCKMH